MDRSIVYCSVFGGSFEDISAGPAKGEYREGLSTPMQRKVGPKITSTRPYEAI